MKGKKKVRYPAKTWLAAEKFFKVVSGAREKGTNVKLNVDGDMFLISNVWTYNNQRYTGIHQVNGLNYVASNSGVNLDDDEWSVLMDNFQAVKDLLRGRKAQLRGVKRKFEESDTITVFTPKWFIGMKELIMGPSVDYFSEDDARNAGMAMEPQEGRDFPKGSGIPILQIMEDEREPMDAVDMMYLILLFVMDKKIAKKVKDECEACQVDSDSQADHCKTGNCLDEGFDYADMYHKQVKSGLNSCELVNVFDATRVKMKAKPINSKSLATAALKWVSDHVVLTDLQNGYGSVVLRPFMDIVSDVYDIVNVN